MYRRFAPAINRRALGMLQDPAEAHDVMQDTFLAYMGNEASLRGEADVFTVLYQIATYKAVDRLRRKSRWSGVLGSLDVKEEEDSNLPGAWAQSSNEGGMTRVEALRDLALLTQDEEPRTLTAAVLYFVEGHTQEEVARILGFEDRKHVSHLLRDFAARARERGARLGKRGTS
ncbi:RNA polymerase sigma factor [Hyalangium rubrum]|uniref:Sigma-70 family RNA polymerase sigma factor n=1 Tax=Hyalangium rubrum TaxID=3103134 RepID=A0ABU5GZ74_9BACT|nr:sigma-70 family RNA polymerase sigma factor [Hyalangium sp. s54d21]MDY7226474.1 sigma-70 family RNA polymerase sigma factor [Hyalangium sp. s54d21]